MDALQAPDAPNVPGAEVLCLQWGLLTLSLLISVLFIDFIGERWIARFSI